MKQVFVPAVLCLTILLTGCGHRSSAEVAATAQMAAKRYPRVHPAAVILTENDITDRPYTSLGDISVTVSKNTIFDNDPSRAQAEAKLREAAADMGANAVVLTRYGAVGVSFWSWGTLEATGRAVRFAN